MGKATKTREPKTKTTTPKVEETKGIRKKTDPKIISKALMSYSAARASVDEARVESNSIEGDTNSSELMHVTKKIRTAISALRNARSEITSELKKNIWVSVMLSHIELWEKDIDTIWEELYENVD